MIEKEEQVEEVAAAAIEPPKTIKLSRKSSKAVEPAAQIEEKKQEERPERKTREQASAEVLKDEEIKLTTKERLFVAEYLTCLNASEAARRAGYSKRSAGELGSRLLKKVEIARALEEKVSELELNAKIDTQWVLRGLRETAERCLTRKPVMDFDYIEKELVQRTNEKGEGVWDFDSMGANKAFETIGKHLGMFKGVSDGGFGDLGGATIIVNPPRQVEQPRQNADN